MKKIGWVLLVVVGLLVLSGCKGATESPPKERPKTLTKQDVIEIVRKSEDNVTYIKQQAGAEVKVTGGVVGASPQTNNSEVAGEMTYKDGVLKELLSNVKQGSREVETYAAGEKIYIRSSGGTWQDISGNGTLQTETTYIPAVDMFTNTADDFKMKKQGNDYVFTFTGTGEKLFEKIRSFYNLRLASIPPSESKLVLTYTVDAKKKYLKQVTQKVTAEKSGQRVEMAIHADFMNYNEKTSLPAPTDINL